MSVGDTRSTSESSSSDDSAGVKICGLTTGLGLFEKNKDVCCVVGDVRKGRVRSLWRVMLINWLHIESGYADLSRLVNLVEVAIFLPIPL